MDGPRALRAGELPALRELTSVVFRPSLVDEYPQLFHADNFANLRVCFDDGRCVSHVGMTQQNAALFGCPVRVGCIGGVATHPDYRGQGLASHCFDDAVNKARGDGVDFMLVSGDRTLYRRRGCLRAGQSEAFTLTAEAAAAAIATAPKVPPVTIEPLAASDLPLIMDCYRREPVRFLRTPDDYQRALDCGVVMDRRSDFLVVRENGDFRGYLIVGQPGEDGRASVAEFAGERRALLAALFALAQQRGSVRELGWQVAEHDDLFRSLCAGAGLSGRPAALPGTVKMIHFSQLMERLRPRWQELLGVRRAARLLFEQHDDEYVIRLGDGDALVADRDTMTRLVFGAPPPDAGAQAQPGVAAGTPTELQRVLATILPLPGLWYGLNYV